MVGAPLKTLLPDTLRCRVTLSLQQIDDFHLDLLVVEACSPAGLDVKGSMLQLEIQDTTEGASDLHAVYEYKGDRDLPEEVFSRQRPLRAISQEESLLEWTTISQIDTRQLSFARQGVRRLLFKLSLVSAAGSPLAEGRDVFEYETPNLGYLDKRENREHIRLQAVQLAGTLVAQDPKSFAPNQSGLLRGWLLADIDLSQVSTRGKQTFEKAFKRLLKACQDTDLEQTLALGQDMASTSTGGQRQEIVEFCLHLICVPESLSTNALVTLQKIAMLWDIDTSQFAMILEKVLSIDRLHEVDPMVLLGMTETMSAEQMLKQLNRAYAKWNARITHTDKAVQELAEGMLSWIAKARGRTRAANTSWASTLNP